MLVDDELLPGAGPVPTSPANRDYQAGFTAAMMLKDLKLAQSAARATRATTPLGAGAAASMSASSKAMTAASIFRGSSATCAALKNLLAGAHPALRIVNEDVTEVTEVPAITASIDRSPFE